MLKPRNRWISVLHYSWMAAMIMIIALLLAMTIFFVGLYIVNFTQRNIQIDPEL